MPLYEYECKKCGHRFEKIQKFSDKMVKKCPECGGQVEQMISAPAVQFKGSGWYVTDYAKKYSSPGSSSSGDSLESKKDDKSKRIALKDSAEGKFLERVLIKAALPRETARRGTGRHKYKRLASPKPANAYVPTQRSTSTPAQSDPRSS